MTQKYTTPTTKVKKNILYLIKHRNIKEYTKIGCTNDLEKRIKSLQTSSPTGIFVLYSKETEAAYQIEQALHKRYEKQRSNLEWFKLTDKDISDIIQWIEKINLKK